MTAKKPSPVTQLKQVLARCKELEELNAKLTKERDSEKQSKDTWYARSNKLEAEIEQVHALLDVLPGAAGRQTNAEESYNRRPIDAMTRLAAYLANRAPVAA